MKSFFFGAFLLASAWVTAQSVHFELKWQPASVVSDMLGGTVTQFSFKGASHDFANPAIPIFNRNIPVRDFGEVEVNIVNQVWEAMPEAAAAQSLRLPSELKVFAAPGIARKQPFAGFSMIPMRRNPATGQIERLVSFTAEPVVTVREDDEPVGGFRGNYATNSALQTGKWYRFAVSEEGIARLTYDDLKAAGMNVDALHPNNLRVYGVGGGMNSEVVTDKRVDDLHEHPIEVTGASDGRFDPGDAIRFYAQAADVWRFNKEAPQPWSYEKHLYDDRNYYFVTADLGPGKRLGKVNSSGSPNTTSVATDILRRHEVDHSNLAESGREWYGEYMSSTQPNFSKSFDMPGLLGSQGVEITVRAAARSFRTGSSIRIQTNDGQTRDRPIPKVIDHYLQPAAAAKDTLYTIHPPGSTVTVNLTFVPDPVDPTSAAWLDHITLVGRASLGLYGPFSWIRDSEVIGPGKVTQFQFPDKPGLRIWNVTNPIEAHEMAFTVSGGQASFHVPTDTLQQFVLFDGSAYITPEFVEQVANQDLHGTLGFPDYVIVTPTALKAQANRLAGIHQARGMDVRVVDLRQVYNEFSGGKADISAIRDMMRMLYDRALAPEEMPVNLCLFGDASFDYKNIEISAENNTNVVPIYQSQTSLSRLFSYASDDFFGLLDLGEGGVIDKGNQLLDIGVGRITAENEEEARIVVDKIQHYVSTQTFGSWRNVISFLADDEDGITHISSSNGSARNVERDYPVYNIDRIYFDSYKQEVTPGGDRYPGVVKDFHDRIFNGALVINYSGHGGEGGWAEERVLKNQDIQGFNNRDKLPLFVTATCSFSRFDNPRKKTGGELLLVKEGGGAVGLVSTTRVVFTHGNDQLQDAYFDKVFEPIDGRMPTVGEVLSSAKNSMKLEQNLTLDANVRKFMLLGDPALTLAYPKHQVVTTKVNTRPVVYDSLTFGKGSIDDTLSALEFVTIEGEVHASGTLMSGFTGIVYPTIYDKLLSFTTLRNDPESNAYSFEEQSSVIYKGKASVVNGKFSFSFVVPKDISYNYGLGKISYYADNGLEDAAGYDFIAVGGAIDSAAADNEGPKVEIFMNDLDFVYGGLTNDEPLMIVKLSDEHGINTTGNSIGHDISSVLDGDENGRFILNQFYEAELDDYTRGEVRYPMAKLEPGTHSVRVKAWDVYNNSGEGHTEFVVAESANLALSHVLNYPNPFTTKTSFWFEHNRPGEQLSVRVQIFTITGTLLKTLQQEVVTKGNRVSDIAWDGLDDYGDPIGRGVYAYRVSVVASDGSRAEELQKLVLLR